MNIRNKIENSKTLLFTSLVAVALLGATQPVSAETYTSRNFDWSGDDWSGDDWPEDDWSGDGLSQYGWSQYGWSSDKEEWPEDDWSSDKKDETEDKTRPPYGEALGTGY
ncbi:TPA: lysis inhibitor protein, partial [Streptococcus pyogenes]